MASGALCAPGFQVTRLPALMDGSPRGFLASAYAGRPVVSVGVLRFLSAPLFFSMNLSKHWKWKISLAWARPVM